MADFTAKGVIEFQFDLEGSIRTSSHAAKARLRFWFGADAPRTRHGVGYRVRGQLGFGFRLTGAISVPVSDSLTVRDIIDEINRTWGGACAPIADCRKAEALAVLNAAMQYIHSNGRDLPYLAERTRYYFMEANSFQPPVHVLKLESDIQQVEGHIRSAKPWASFVFPLNDTDSDPPPVEIDLMAGSDVKLVFGFNSLATTLTISDAWTTALGLQAIIQALIQNEARVWVTYKARMYLKITFDTVPAFVVHPGSGDDFLYNDGPDSARFTDDADQEIAPSTVFSSEEGAVIVPIGPIRSRPALDSYTGIYGPTAPTKYYLERQHTPVEDSAQVYLLLTPKFSEDTIIGMDVQIEPRRFTWADYDKATVIPIPHKYHESILLPIVRYIATGHKNYRQRERHQTILDQYAEAQRLLGVVDPQTSPAREGKEAAV